MPRFREPETYRFQAGALLAGLGFLGIGLVKKCVLADGSAGIAEALFDRSGDSSVPSCLDAWQGTLGYSFQLYFDFSGYSDMALGLAAMFGLPLPYNFNSPYQAGSLVDFWRRWHMTLSRFLRDYVYIPMGGSRCSPWRRHFNLAATMVLGGFWHGAKWTFVIWGVWHGLFLLLNHLWRDHSGNTDSPARETSRPTRWLGVAMTFLIVTLGWVWFRSPNVGSAVQVFEALAGIGTPAVLVKSSHFIQGIWLTLCGLLIFACPNTRHWVEAGLKSVEDWQKAQEAGDTAGSGKRLFVLVSTLGFCFGMGLIFLRHRSTFLYFQF